MKYADFKESELGQSGDLLAWTHKWHGLSWYELKVAAIRVFDKTEYTHVGVLHRAPGNRLMVFEAVSGGVRHWPLSKLLPCFHVNLSRWTRESEDFAWAHIGEKYSTWDALKAKFGLLEAGGNHLWQCAEYAHEILKRAGIYIGAPYIPSVMVERALQLKNAKLTLLEK